MFNLIISIIAIAIVIIASITTIYYLGDISKSSKNFIIATTYSNQASQLFAGAQMYYNDNLQWPQAPEALVPKYISALPVPPSTTQQLAFNYIKPAYATGKNEWAFVHDDKGVLTYIVFKSLVAQSDCAAQTIRNQLGRDDSQADLLQVNLPSDLNPKLVAQCVQDLKYDGANEGNSFFWFTGQGDPAQAVNRFNLDEDTDYTLDGRVDTGGPWTGIRFCTSGFACNSGGLSPGQLQPGQPISSFWLPNSQYGGISVQNQQAPLTIQGQASLVVNQNMGTYSLWTPNDEASARALACSKMSPSGGTSTPTGSLSVVNGVATTQCLETDRWGNKATRNALVGEMHVLTTQEGYGNGAGYAQGVKGCIARATSGNCARNQDPPFPQQPGCAFSLNSSGGLVPSGNCPSASTMANQILNNQGNAVSVCGGVAGGAFGTGGNEASARTGTVSVAVCRGSQVKGTCNVSFVNGVVSGMENCPAG